MLKVTENHRKEETTGVYLLRINKRVIDTILSSFVCRNLGELLVACGFVA